MERAGHNNVKFFVGSEVEHSAAFSKKTLFVVGAELDEIIKAAQEHKVAHVFLTANQSFNKVFNEYDAQAIALIDMGYWVTIEYPMEEHSYMLNNLSAKVWQSKLFIPMATCKIKNISNCSHNFTIKIDDPTFTGPNGGVWCWDRAILDSNRFTPWSDYENDEVIYTSQVFEISDEQLEQGMLEKIKKGVTQRKAELLPVGMGASLVDNNMLKESGIPVYSDGTPAKMLMPGEDDSLAEDLFNEIDGKNAIATISENNLDVPGKEKTTSASIDGDDNELVLATKKNPNTK